MHVLIIPSWYPDDREDIKGSFFREQAISLKKIGVDVGVVSLQLCSLRKWRALFTCRYGISFEIDEGVPTYRKYGVDWFPRIRTLQWSRARSYGMEVVERYISQYGIPDIIHVHSMFNAGSIALEVKSRYGVPYVITEHSSIFGLKGVNKAQLSLALNVSKHAERRFAVSSKLALLLEKTIDMSGGCWDVMPNIVNESFLDYPLENNQKFLFTFLNVCILSENKRVDLLIKGFAQAFKGQENCRLRIGGDGEQRKVLESLVKELGVLKQVEFLGLLSREDVKQEMHSANTFVLTSDYETFGVVLIESLALGVPVIATRCGGPEDIVREEDGILIKKGDVAGMASAMKDMYNLNFFYTKHHIRNSCRQRFSEKVISKKILKVYSEIC
jgi:glycosyltransferase involved in cell wall biosynthesis